MRYCKMFTIFYNGIFYKIMCCAMQYFIRNLLERFSDVDKDPNRSPKKSCISSY